MSSTENQTTERKVSIPLGFGILFIPFIFAWFTLRKGYSTKAKAISFIWFVLALLIFKGNTDKNKTELVNSSQASVEGAPAAPQIEYVKDGCKEVAKKFSSDSHLSELQKNEAWKIYEGKAFKWNLIVQEVEESGDGFRVDYKCTNSDSIIKDVEVNYTAADKNLVLGLVKGKSYPVTGKFIEFSVLAITAEKL